MDWFSGIQKNLSAAAQDAAERAQKLAQQASVQARAMAEQASEKAKALATQAAQEAQQQLSQLKQAAAAGGGSSGGEDPLYYGITDALVEQVSCMTYNTFSDAHASTATPAGDASDFRLSPWQEKHVLMVLSRVEQLQHLRYALCPKRMDEQQFWTIYFAQVKDLLPPQAFGLAPEPPRPVAASTAAASTSGRPSGSSTAGAGASGGLGAAPSPTTATPAGGGVSSAAKAVAGGSLVGSRSVGEAADAAAGEGTAGAGRLKGHDSAGAAAAPLSPSAAAHLDEDGDVDGDVEDGLDELEDDPELAAYLQEALALDDEQGELGSADLGSVADEDLDDYINQLQEEEDGLSKLSTPAKPGIEHSKSP